MNHHDILAGLNRLRRRMVHALAPDLIKLLAELEDAEQALRARVRLLERAITDERKTKEALEQAVGNANLHYRQAMREVQALKEGEATPDRVRTHVDATLRRVRRLLQAEVKEGDIFDALTVFDIIRRERNRLWSERDPDRNI